MIHLLHTRATKQQLEEMLETLEDYIKLALDVQRGIVAGGGELHSDCESVLLADGSRQEDIWGAGSDSAGTRGTFRSNAQHSPKAK